MTVISRMLGIVMMVSEVAIPAIMLALLGMIFSGMVACGAIDAGGFGGGGWQRWAAHYGRSSRGD